MNKRANAARDAGRIAATAAGASGPSGTLDLASAVPAKRAKELQQHAAVDGPARHDATPAPSSYNAASLPRSSTGRFKRRAGGNEAALAGAREGTPLLADDQSDADARRATGAGASTSAPAGVCALGGGTARGNRTPGDYYSPGEKAAMESALLDHASAHQLDPAVSEWMYEVTKPQKKAIAAAAKLPHLTWRMVWKHLQQSKGLPRKVVVAQEDAPTDAGEKPGAALPVTVMPVADAAAETGAAETAQDALKSKTVAAPAAGEVATFDEAEASKAVSTSGRLGCKLGVAAPPPASAFAALSVEGSRAAEVEVEEEPAARRSAIVLTGREASGVCTSSMWGDSLYNGGPANQLGAPSYAARAAVWDTGTTATSGAAQIDSQDNDHSAGGAAASGLNFEGGLLVPTQVITGQAPPSEASEDWSDDEQHLQADAGWDLVYQAAGGQECKWLFRSPPPSLVG